MRKVNASKASKALKRYFAETGDQKISKDEFIDFMLNLMKKMDFCDTNSEREMMKLGFDDVFEVFDYDKSGYLDREEIANCLSLMCGGTINEKIFAAFNMFDQNNSMTLSFDELNKFIKVVFQIFEALNGGNVEGIWKTVDFKKLIFATSEKCFSDNKVVKGKGEINYTQFI